MRMTNRSIVYGCIAEKWAVDAGVSVCGQDSLFDQAQGNDVVDKADKSREVAPLEQPEERGVAHQRLCEFSDVLQA